MSSVERVEQAAATSADGLIDALVQTAFATMAILTKAGAEEDMSLTQLRVFGILRDRRVRMTALADFLGLEKSTMSGLVDRAEKKGLVERAPNESDGRAVDVVLSAQGSKVMQRLYARIRLSLSAMTENLTPAQQRQLQALLEPLFDGLEL